MPEKTLREEIDRIIEKTRGCARAHSTDHSKRHADLLEQAFLAACERATSEEAYGAFDKITIPYVDGYNAARRDVLSNLKHEINSTESNPER